MKLLGGAAVGIHSMVDEHFGISVVEYMASGAIPIGVFPIFHIIVILWCYMYLVFSVFAINLRVFLSC